MRITPVEKEQAPETVRPVYEALEKKFGRVTSFYKVLANWPEVLAGFTQMYDAVWAESKLPPNLKELAYLRTSILNGCEY